MTKDLDADEHTAQLFKLTDDSARYKKWAAHTSLDTIMMTDGLGSIVLSRQEADELAVWLRCRLDATSGGRG